MNKITNYKKFLKFILLFFLIFLLVIIILLIKYKYQNNQNNNNDTLKNESVIKDFVKKPFFDLNTENNYKPKTISEAHNNLGLKIFKNILNEKYKSKNILISPTSISLALSMMYNGALDNTLEQMKKVLNYENFSLDEINTSNNKIIESLTNSKEIVLKIANSIWLNSSNEYLKINKDFMNIIENYYLSEVNQINFLNPNFLDILNNWIKEKTNNYINKIEIEKPKKDDTFYLINTLFFQSNWRKPFDINLTKKRLFQSFNKKEKQVLMMEKEDIYEYLENDIFQSVILDYLDTIKLYLYLPKKDKFYDFMKIFNLNNLNLWQKDQYKLRKGLVIIPKLNFQDDIDLNKNLIELGMIDSFNIKKANFYNLLTPDSYPIFINKIKHLTKIEIDEKGTKAGAITIIMPISGGGFVSEEPPFYFEANRPFIFIIKDTKTEEFLFLGFINEI